MVRSVENHPTFHFWRNRVNPDDRHWSDFLLFVRSVDVNQVSLPKRNRLNAISLNLLAAYFALLAVFGKDFSYLHISLGPLPLFVGEAALTVALLRSLWDGRPLAFGIRATPLFAFGLLIFIAWGALRTTMSIAQSHDEFGIVQIIRDACIWYQAAWAWFAFRLAPDERKKLFHAILVGVGLSQGISWIAAFSDRNFDLRPWRNPFGNEVVSPLFPLAGILWRRLPAVGLATLFGAALFFQLLYLKRNWAFSVVAIGSIGLLIATYRLERFRRLGDWAIGCVVGIVLGWLSLTVWPRTGSPETFFQGVTFKRETIDPSSIIETTGSERWLYHGELVVDANGKVQSRMAFRMHLWKQTWDGWRQKPVFGHGFGPRMFTTQVNGYPAMSEGKWISGPHNSYLTIAFRMGAFGLLACLAILLGGFLAFLRRPKSPEAYFALFATASTWFYAVFNVCLENPQAGVWPWLFLGCLAAPLSRENESKAEAYR